MYIAWTIINSIIAVIAGIGNLLGLNFKINFRKEIKIKFLHFMEKQDGNYSFSLHLSLLKSEKHVRLTRIFSPSGKLTYDILPKISSKKIIKGDKSKSLKKEKKSACNLVIDEHGKCHGNGINLSEVGEAITDTITFSFNAKSASKKKATICVNYKTNSRYNSTHTLKEILPI